MQGPPNPDVFQMPNDNEVPFMLEEIVKGSKIVQEEILFMLNQVNIPPKACFSVNASILSPSQYRIKSK